MSILLNATRVVHHQIIRFPKLRIQSTMFTLHCSNQTPCVENAGHEGSDGYDNQQNCQTQHRSFLKVVSNFRGDRFQIFGWTRRSQCIALSHYYFFLVHGALSGVASFGGGQLVTHVARRCFPKKVVWAFLFDVFFVISARLKFLYFFYCGVCWYNATLENCHHLWFLSIHQSWIDFVSQYIKWLL